MMKTAIHFGATFLLGIVLCGCGSGDVPAIDPAPAADEPEQIEPEIEPAPEPEPPPPGLAPFVAPFKGDLDGMLDRRIVRVLTVQSPVQYFVDRGRELGIT